MVKMIDLAFEFWEYEINPKRSKKAKEKRYNAMYNALEQLDKLDARLIIDLCFYAVKKDLSKDFVLKVYDLIEGFHGA